MAIIEERPEEVKLLRCTTCGYEIASSWFLVSPQGTLSVLKPVSCHYECCVGMNIGAFTTVDGSSSTPVGASLYSSNYKNMVEMPKQAATGRRPPCYDTAIWPPSNHRRHIHP